ncbi:hypothetical protein PG911_07270 [Tenacibaculum ovolyticum]|uniref:hypothetical protein n=1 Tax=Tenacibaculum ovolyticum TaxID=104270 RepID=UPI0022F3C3D5|nr:hypothetical protein [Tenacibaculum ovolyticum]WBX78048.1 hypothetical protein PG911_07270 [Tenacibaculum ovolyticum]
MKNKTIPPVLFKEMYSLLEVEYQEKLDNLIQLKSENIEKSTLSVDNDLINLVKNIVEENNDLKNSLLNKKPKKEDFNSFFIKNV